jgi:hypothetical protein
MRQSTVGLAGDFFVVIGLSRSNEAFIWFCVRSHNDHTGEPAKWAVIPTSPTFRRNGGDLAVLDL